jgi:hypothetical protein
LIREGSERIVKKYKFFCSQEGFFESENAFRLLQKKRLIFTLSGKDMVTFRVHTALTGTAEIL